MQYRAGSIGRVFVVRFQDTEDVINGIESLAKKESIGSAVLYLIGGMRQGKVVVGPERDEIPPKPIWRDFTEPHEVLAIGTIFNSESGPKLHLHGAYARGDSVKVGCLRELSEAFLVLEAVVLEVNGIDAKREFDPASGLTLLRL